MIKTDTYPIKLDVVVDQIKQIGDRGSILEVSSQSTNMDKYLNNSFPKWKFVNICQTDLDNTVFNTNSSFFIKNIQLFDVINVNIIKPKLDWNFLYQQLSMLLKDGGIIIAQNLSNSVHGEYIKQAIRNLHFLTLENSNEIEVLRKKTIRYGSYDIDLDIESYNEKSNILLTSNKIKISGANGFNKFISVSSDDKIFLSKYINNKLVSNFEWNFEYFHSGEPAGLHTDYLSIPNSWKPKEAGIHTHDVHIVIGVIIPLEWHCKQPYTVNYNKVSNVPRKLIYRNGEMRYMDNNEIFHYREGTEDQWVYDLDVLNYNPKDTQYHREYAGLTVHSVYEWKKGTMMVFDAARWHSSSWFLTTNTLPQVSTEYKKSIIGFGSIDVDRWL